MSCVSDIVVIPDAKLIPMRRGSGLFGSLFSSYGAIDGTGRRFPKWPLLSSLDTSFAVNVLRGRPSSSDQSLPEAIFGGLYYNWFGHFITETVPNLLAAKIALEHAPDLPIVFFVPDNRTKEDHYPELSPWALFFLEHIGLDPTKFHFIRQPLHVRRLVFGPTPFTRKFHFAPWSLLALDQLFGAKSIGSTSDLYLSRSKWSNVRTSDESIIERHFSSRGFDVVHMEALSLSDQISSIRGARHVAGCTGTALHWSLYSKTCESVIALGYRSPLQRGISKSRGQIYVNPPGRRVADASIRVRDFDIRSLDCALDHVGVALI